MQLRRPSCLLHPGRPSPRRVSHLRASGARPRVGGEAPVHLSPYARRRGHRKGSRQWARRRAPGTRVLRYYTRLLRPDTWWHTGPTRPRCFRTIRHIVVQHDVAPRDFESRPPGELAAARLRRACPRPWESAEAPGREQVVAPTCRANAAVAAGGVVGAAAAEIIAGGPRAGAAASDQVPSSRLDSHQVACNRDAPRRPR
jgi:hypothetical protein